MVSRVQRFTIKARDDAGQQYILHVSCPYQVAPGSGPPVEAAIGGGSITTNRGESVEYVAKGHYRMLDGRELRSDDPKAP
jgi:hypothetical protein